MKFVILGIGCFSFLLTASVTHGQNACRPCGPDSLRGPLRYLIPQGAGGADFRSACRAHDACYSRAGADRNACDCRFREQLMRECERSRNPRRCRRVAMIMYRSVRKYGDQSFRKSQTE
ncbi:MAG: hypothetical protein MK108_11385 [Mariniblastus sp.]|nr:hypothetical protein [Mariniblastus sp.]